MMTSMKMIEDQLSELAEVVQKSSVLIPTLEKVVEVVYQALQKGNKVLSCGNGGSSTDAQHLVEEFVGRYRGNRRSLPGICLSADPSIMTCIANDYGYDEVFARQVEGNGVKGDILFIFTTSGGSQNCVRALEQAKKQGIITVAVLGKDGGKCKGMADYELIVPSNNTARIQEMHTWILHIVLEYIESKYVLG
jgi:D-sedoheptulose 7-phosphate isomerase